MALDIDIKNLKRVSIITIKGRVDSGNAPELESAFQTFDGQRALPPGGRSGRSGIHQ